MEHHHQLDQRPDVGRPGEGDPHGQKPEDQHGPLADEDGLLLGDVLLDEAPDDVLRQDGVRAHEAGVQGGHAARPDNHHQPGHQPGGLLLDGHEDGLVHVQAGAGEDAADHPQEEEDHDHHEQHRRRQHHVPAILVQAADGVHARHAISHREGMGGHEHEPAEEEPEGYGVGRKQGMRLGQLVDHRGVAAHGVEEIREGHHAERQGEHAL